MKEFRDFLIRYKGAIIGGLIALLMLILRLHVILMWAVVLVFGIFVGNYVQNNKELVKDKLKFFIDKL